MSIDLKQINPRNILILNTYGIGDVLFSTPFLYDLHAQLPQTRISYMANRRVGSLLENISFLDKIFIYERDEFFQVYQSSKWQYWKKIRGFVDGMKKESFDIIFDFSMNGAMNFMVRKMRAKHRMGFNYKNRSKFLTYAKRINGFEGQPVAQYYLDLLEEIGLKGGSSSLRLPVAPKDQDAIEQILKAASIPLDRPLLGIFPGGGASWGAQAHLKRWPVAKYRKLIEKCVENLDAAIILMGDKTEKELCLELASGIDNVHNLCGQTSLGQLAALLERCHLAVVNDGGPLHIAVAVGTKTVSIFGPVDEMVYGPFGDPRKHLVATSTLACRPCYRAFRMSDCTHLSCLQNLDVSSVYTKIEKLL